MAQVWLHIGTPKTGSTAIQLFGRDRAEYLAGERVRFVTLGRRASFNKLAKAMRQQDEAAVESWAQTGEAGIREAAEQADHVVVSSEMLSTNGVDLGRLRDLMPSLDQMPVNIVVYVRRQDRYLESFYKQRVKTGRFTGSLSEYIASRRDAYGDYDRLIDRCTEAFPEARVYLRRFEKARMVQGSVVADLLALMGVDALPSGVGKRQRANVAPSVEMLELLRLLRRSGPYDLEKLRPVLQAHMPQAVGTSRLMTPAEARAVIDHYAETNETLRARFFPDDATLFDMSDLSDAAEQERAAAEVFSDDQREIIGALLAAISRVHLKDKAA